MRNLTPNIDYTSKDYEAFRELMIKKLKEKMPEYTDTSDTDAGIVILEALANGLDIISLYADIVANDTILPTTQSRRMAVLISECLGYHPYNQTASEYEQVFVLSSIRDEDTIIPKGTLIRTTSDNDLVSLPYETMYDLIIPAGKLGNEKDDHGNYLYTVKIQAGESIFQDVIGTSSGSPLQSFKCSYTNVLIDSLQVYIDEGNDEEIWTRVDSFYDCDANSKVFMTLVDDFDACVIQFGNGLKGKIPNSFPNGITASYRIGGGEGSNVGANIITDLESNIAFVESTFNLEANILGHDKETLESIKQNAPASYRSQDRFVTLRDYEDLLRIHYYDFIALKAVRDTEDKKLAHVFYLMREGYSFTPELLADITAYIGDRSMIGTTFDLAEYTPQDVNITAKVFVDKDYDASIIVENIKRYLKEVIFRYGELKFEDYLIKSDLESEIKEVFEGVLSFRINSPTSDIIAPSQPNNILRLGTVNISSESI